MKKIKRFFGWINKNKEWLFSGIGITIITLFLTTCNSNKETHVDINDKSNDRNIMESTD